MFSDRGSNGGVGGDQKAGSVVAAGIAYNYIYEGGMLAKVWGWFSRWRAARSKPELLFEFEQSVDSLTTPHHLMRSISMVSNPRLE